MKSRSGIETISGHYKYLYEPKYTLSSSLKSPFYLTEEIRFVLYHTSEIHNEACDRLKEVNENSVLESIYRVEFSFASSDFIESGDYIYVVTCKEAADTAPTWKIYLRTAAWSSRDGMRLLYMRKGVAPLLQDLLNGLLATRDYSWVGNSVLGILTSVSQTPKSGGKPSKLKPHDGKHTSIRGFFCPSTMR